MAIEIKTPFTRETLKNLKAGDNVLITGTIYTARDAAHKRLVELLNEGKKLPFDPKGACIYYVGPSPAKPGRVIGSAGPTTSYRMDPYAPQMMDAGVMGMIGKGKRDDNVKAKIVEHGACYFAAIGGAAAIIADRIKTAKIIAYEDLGAEALREITVEKFPATVIVDPTGKDLYIEGKKEYLEWKEKNE